MIYAEPNVNENILKSKFENNITITKKDGSKIEGGVIGTGYKVTIGNDTFTISKLGDANGDGNISITDSYIVKLVMNGKYSLEDEAYNNAADVNGDGKISITDSYIIKLRMNGNTKLEVK